LGSQAARLPRLLDPTGTAIGRGCIINGAGTIDRTALMVDGDYTVLIEGNDGDTGKAMARVYESQDIDGTIEPGGASVTVALEQPGSVARYGFTGSAGQRVYLEADSSLPSQCSPLRLFSEDGRNLASGCVINGTGVIEGTVLPADGTYSVAVDPGSRTIGTVHMRLFATMDQVGGITVDGPSVVATIEAPGGVVRYEFTAAAGTSVTVAATDSTLPSQCSLLRLFDEDGEQVGSGCVISGEGEISSTVLPDAGVYVIEVDPNRSATGSLTLSLHTA
jgi:hypothetical protein